MRTNGESKRGWVLPVLLVGQAMASMDVSIVNVALPSVARDLGATGAQLQLTSAAYMLAFAVLLVAGARWGDSRGHRTAFVVGLAGFTAASLACGLAPAMWSLLSARAVQGAAAALMVPQVLSLIQRSFGGAERLRALGMYSAILAIGVAAGQVLGGLLVTSDVAGTGWRSAFLVNVPVGAVLLLAAPRCLPDSRSGRRGFDVAGMAVLGLAMLLVVAPLTIGREQGWPVWSVICLGLAGPALAAFVRVERAVAGHGAEPLVDLSLFGRRGLALGLSAIGLVMAGYAVVIFTLSLHLQMGLGYSPLRSGLTFLPYALGFFTVSVTWRRLPVPHAWMAPCGFVVMAAGLAALAMTLSGGAVPLLAIGLLFAAGAGHAGAFAPLAVAVTGLARPEQAGSLSGLLSTSTLMGSVLGVAAGGGAYLTVTAQRGSALGFAVVALAVAVAMLVSSAAAARVTVWEATPLRIAA